MRKRKPKSIWAYEKTNWSLERDVSWEEQKYRVLYSVLSVVMVLGLLLRKLLVFPGISERRAAAEAERERRLDERFREGKEYLDRGFSLHWGKNAEPWRR